MSQEVHFQQQIHEFDGLPDVKTQIIVALGVNVAAIINIFFCDSSGAATRNTAFMVHYLVCALASIWLPP